MAFGGMLSSSETLRVPHLSAYVFLGTDCPISQDYVGVLNEMMIEYAGKVTFHGIVPEPGDAREVEEFRREYEVKFELTSDRELTLTTTYGVRVTPEVVLLDDNDVVRYQGAIDNWYYALGKHRQSATEHWLKDAIDTLLDGHRVKVAKTEAVGCLINLPAHRH